MSRWAVDMEDGSTLTVDAADEAQAARVASEIWQRRKAAPAKSSSGVRDFAEGAARSIIDTSSLYGRVLAPGANAPVIGEYLYDKPADLLRGAAGRISDVEPENPTRAYAAGSGAGGALASLPITIATGGASAPLMAAQMAGGMAGGLASDEARRRGVGGLGQAAAGFAGDLATGGLVRGALAAPGAIARAVSPTARAGNYVRDLGLGVENADEAAAAIDDAFRIGGEDVDKAWDAYRAVPTQATTSAEPFHRLAAAQVAETALKPSDLPEIASRIPKTFTDEVGAGDVQKLLKSVSSTQRDDVPDNMKRLAGQFREVAEGALDEIEAVSATDAAAVKALRAARNASREFADAFPDDSALFKTFLSKNAMDNPQEAFVKLLGSPKREREMSLVLRAVRGNPAAQRGVKRAVVQAVLGNTEELAGGRVAGALDRLNKYEGAARQALGDPGFDQLKRLLSEQATANRKSGWLWRHLTPTGSGIRGAAVGTMVGGQLAGAEGANVGFVAGGALDVLADRLSQRAVREIAIRSTYDPELYRQVSRAAPQGVKRAEWLSLLLGSLVRRGVIDQEEVSGDPATTTRSGAPR